MLLPLAKQLVTLLSSFAAVTVAVGRSEQLLAVDGVPLWVAAAMHDVAMEFVKSKFRLFHRIDPDVDAEREFIAGNLAETRQLTGEEYVRGTKPVFAAETGTGQPYYSDSRLLLELNREAISTAGKTEVASKLR